MAAAGRLAVVCAHTKDGDEGGWHAAHEIGDDPQLPLVQVSFSHRLAGALGVQRGEGRPLALLVAYSFFSGVSRLIIITSSNALLLADRGSSILPYLYIGTSLVVPVGGLAYSRLEQGRSLPRFVALTLATLIIPTAVFRVLVVLPGLGGWPALALSIWAYVVSTELLITGGALASRLFDIRQSKRLSGVSGAGDTVGTLAGGLIAPLLAPVIGAHNLLLVSIAAMGLQLALAVHVFRSFPESFGVGSEPRSSGEVRAASGPLRHPFQDRYVGHLFLLTIVVTICYYILDAGFLLESSARIPEAQDLAGFLGLFFAVASGLVLLVKSVLTGRILSRFGMATCLRILPVATLVGAAAILLASRVTTAVGTIFWMAAGIRLLFQVAFHGFHRPAFFVLYQSLPLAQRLRAQTFTEGIAEFAAGGAVGAGLLVCARFAPVDMLRLAGATLVVISMSVPLVGLVEKGYWARLVKAVAQRSLEVPDLSFGENSSLIILERSLQSSYAGEVIYALDRLEEVEHPSYSSHLARLLPHPALEVRARVLAGIERSRLTSVVESVLRAARTDESTRIRAAAIRAACAVGKADVLGQVALFLDESDACIRQGALVGMLRSGGIEGVLQAGEQLLQMVGSPESADRRLAADVLGEVAIWSFCRPLEKLLDDGDIAVRRSALAAAGKLKSPVLWPIVLRNVGVQGVQYAASSALAAGGVDVLPSLEPVLRGDTGDWSTRLHVIRVCGQIGGPRALVLLKDALASPDLEVRHFVLAALSRCRYRANEGEAAAVREHLGREASGLAFCLAAMVDLQPEAWASKLMRALQRELERGQERIFYLLSFLYDGEMLPAAQRRLRGGDRLERAYALEMIEAILSVDLRKRVLPLLDDAPPDQMLARLGTEVERGRTPARTWPGEILDRSPEWITPWTTACALEAGRGLGGTDGRVEALITRAACPLVRETAAWASREDGGEARSADGAVQGGPGDTEGETMLITIEKVMILRTIGIFSLMPDDALASVATIMEAAEVKEGETILRESEMGSAMYVIVDGEVRIHTGGRTIATMGSREVFGELAALRPQPRTASVTATKATRVLRLEHDRLLDVMCERTDLTRGIIYFLCDRYPPARP